jgi:diacylglycerol kinase
VVIVVDRLDVAWDGCYSLFRIVAIRSIAVVPVAVFWVCCFGVWFVVVDDASMMMMMMMMIIMMVPILKTNIEE